MTRDEIRNVIDDYLALVESDDGDLENREATLKGALDRLALAYHFADFTFDESSYPDAPQSDYAALRKRVETRFPNYGYYNTPNEITTNLEQSKMLVGDAIDDIADIARDLREVVWCWDNTSVEDALWHFKFGYESHWGMHLRCLQLYLLALNWGQ